jgi:hypothetical protein
MEGFLKAVHVEHKYAVRLQTVLNRAKVAAECLTPYALT